MKRLTAGAAAILREEINAGRTIYNIDTHMQMYGSCMYFRPKPCSEPTAAPPGSAAKIAVFCDRLKRGESLYHPMDNSTPPAPTQLEPRYVSGIRIISLDEISD